MTSLSKGNGDYSMPWLAVLLVFVWLGVFNTVMAAENQPPSATGQALSTKEDTKKSITLSGKDPEKKKLTYAIVRQPTHGTLTLKANKATYIPAKDYFSPAGLPDSFTFKVNDGLLGSAPATVTLNVTPVNDKPIALGGSAMAVKNTPQEIALSATDVEGDALTYIPVKKTKKGGTVILKADKLVTYTPKKDFVGADSFTFTVKDSQKGVSSSATVAITVMSTDCPLPDPVLGGQVVKGLTCLDKADINYYKKMVLPYLTNAQDAAQAQADVAGESWSAEAAQKSIDANPMLIGFQGVDSALEGVDTALKGKIVTAALQFSVSISRFATEIVNSSFIVNGSTGTEQATAVSDASEVVSGVLETFANTSACVSAIYDKDVEGKSGCFDAVSKALDTVAKVHPDTLTKITGMDKATFEAKLTLLSDSASAASAIWKLAKSESLGDAQRALFGMANGFVKMLRDAAVLAYTSKGEEIPTTGWQATSLLAIDYATIPLLTLGEKCWGNADSAPIKAAIQAVQCGSTILQESSKVAIRGLAAGTGVITGVRDVGAHTNLLVAQAVIEEMLKVGRNNLPSLYSKYGMTYDDSGSLSAYLSKLALVKAIGVKPANGTFYFVPSALSTVDTYLQQIYSRVYLDMNSANITLTANVDPLLGGVLVKASVTPDTKIFSKGTLACYSNDTSDHSLSNPLEGQVNGVTNLSFKFNFTTGGHKAISCALYRGNGLFDVAKSVGILLPANFSFTPTTATAGAEIKFIGGAKGPATGYTWEFGDGETDSSIVFLKTITNHTYAKAGSYKVKLTITGGALSSVVTKTIVVGEALDENPKDGIPDWWEAKYGVTYANADDDWDGLTNLEEYNAGTKPKGEGAHDTDGDGFTDGEEVDAGTDPLDKTKYPDLTLSAPQNIKVVEGDGKVTLSWDTVKGAATYQVCNDSSWNEFGSYGTRSCESNKPYGARWQSTASSTITLTALPDGSPLLNGTTYGLTVFAQDTNGKDGLGAEIDVTPKKIATTIGKLNDTGITTCSNATTNGLPCPQAGFPGQDAESGRDANQATNNDADGHAGFSFTKISSTGQELPASATEWSCVKDNVTGLMWEVKTDDSGLHDKDNSYSWYEPDSTKNAGSAGTPNNGVCGGTSQCDTYSYVRAVNVTGWCGYKDWRLPKVRELQSLVDFSINTDNIEDKPAIDNDFFPDTQSSGYWSQRAYFDAATPNFNYAWYVRFHGLAGNWIAGRSYVHYSSSNLSLRLVR